MTNQINPDHRVINGLLKEGMTLDAAGAALRRNFVIRIDPKRATRDDLWPCIWALVIVLERQFAGSIYLPGVRAQLSAPILLDPRRTFFDAAPPPDQPCMRIGLGIAAPDLDMYGNAGDQDVTIDPRVSLDGRATVVTGFALAAYLGFGALALAAGLPPNRDRFAKNKIRFDRIRFESDVETLTLMGLGQLGQSYLALLYFIREYYERAPKLLLLDKDDFSIENRPTQILFRESATGESKAECLAQELRAFGFHAEGVKTEIGWDSRRRAGDAQVALLGFDNMPSRRMAFSMGYDRLLVGGIGASFTQPRVTWHDLPGDKAFASIFGDQERATAINVNPDVQHQLKQENAGCGWLTFKQVTASAPAMGMLAAALVVPRIFRRRGAGHQGGGMLWSHLLPTWEDEVVRRPQPA
jgi:hypothetical protein